MRTERAPPLTYLNQPPLQIRHWRGKRRRWLIRPQMIFQIAWLRWVFRVLLLLTLKCPLLSFQRRRNLWWSTIHWATSGIPTKMEAVLAITQTPLHLVHQLEQWPQLLTLLSSVLSTWATLTGTLRPSRPLHLRSHLSAMPPRPSQWQKCRMPQAMTKEQAPDVLHRCATRSALSWTGYSSKTWLKLRTRWRDAKTWSHSS